MCAEFRDRFQGRNVSRPRRSQTRRSSDFESGEAARGSQAALGKNVVPGGLLSDPARKPDQYCIRAQWPAGASHTVAAVPLSKDEPTLFHKSLFRRAVQSRLSSRPKVLCPEGKDSVERISKCTPGHPASCLKW